MKKLLLYIFFMAIAITSCSHKETKSEPEVAVDTTREMVLQIQKCSRLYAAEYHVRKIVMHEDQKQIKGSFMKKDFNINLPVGTRKVAIPIDATLKAYVDFSKFSEKNIKRNGDKVEVILPDPQIVISSTKIDHNGVKQYIPLTRGRFEDAELTQYAQQGRAAIESEVPKLGLMETSQSCAARTIIPIIVAMGYKEENITVTFRKGISVDDIRRFIMKGVEGNG